LDPQALPNLQNPKTPQYLMNLPRDTDTDEPLQRFGKCGVINEDGEGESKAKTHARDNGSSSGEGLVVFFKED